MRFDCQSCGACCCNTAKNMAEGSRAYVEVEPGDELYKSHRELLKTMSVRISAGTFGGGTYLKLVGDEQRCVNLEGDIGEGVGCAIYKLRPSGCRRVEAGDAECLRARRHHGLSLLTEH